MQTTIGIDVGNYDTKSKHTITVSGYTAYNNEQLLADNVLVYNGKYYVESIDNRLPFVEDKTNNDQSLILTLFSIAKELIWRIRNEKHLVGNIQNEILNYDCINLAIGLPPGHFNKLARKTVEYYKEQLGKGVKFKYANYDFSFKLGKIECYAQDLTAVVMNQNLSVSDAENGPAKYYIIGIGGYTVDVVPINNGAPEIDNCRSLPLGTRPMFETIISRIQSSTGVTLDEKTVESVLRDKKCFLSDEVKSEIKYNANLHAEQVVDKCIQAGCLLNIYPAVYVGGGCLLLKDSLNANSKVCFSEFIDDIHANASSYEEFLKYKYDFAS